MQGQLVEEWLEDFLDDKESVDKEQRMWTGDFQELVPFSILCWEEWPPDMEAELQGLGELLHENEYMIFDWFTRFGYVEDTYAIIAVTAAGVTTDSLSRMVSFCNKLRKANKRSLVANEYPDE